MADTDVAGLRQRLRTALQDYLTRRSPWLPPLREALLSLPAVPRVVLFGGLLRDLVMHGGDARPRDVDLVIDGASFERTAEALRPFVQRPTRFGGLQLIVSGVEVDLWHLSGTWAFGRLGVLDPSFADLTRTTFLDIEAVAAELPLGRGPEGLLYERGFFRAVSRRTIDINFEDNPYPDLCAVRSLALATRQGFSIGPRLATFVASRLDRMTDEDLSKVHSSTHWAHPCPVCLYRRWRDAIRAAGPESNVPPPVSPSLSTAAW